MKKGAANCYILVKWLSSKRSLLGCFILRRRLPERVFVHAHSVSFAFGQAVYVSMCSILGALASITAVALFTSG